MTNNSRGSDNQVATNELKDDGLNAGNADDSNKENQLSQVLLELIPVALGIVTVFYFILNHFSVFPTKEETELIFTLANYVIIFVTFIGFAIKILKSNSNTMPTPILKCIKKISASVLLTFSTFLIFILVNANSETIIIFVPDGERDLIVLEMLVEPDDLIEHTFNTNDSETLENSLIHPFLSEYELVNPNKIHTLFKESGLLNEKLQTLPLADNNILNDLKSDDTYWINTQRWKEPYKNDLNVLLSNKELSKDEARLSEAIDLYYEMNQDFMEAKDWSMNNAGGVCPNLLAMIARNHAERAHLLARRNTGYDAEIALEEYVDAINTYALLYRTLIENDMEETVQYYNIYFWLASAYHNMGNLLLRNFPHTLGNYASASSFFKEEYSSQPRNSEMRTYRAYSIYFSALTSHKICNMYVKDNPNDLPRELKYYLRNARNNYFNSIENIELREVARDNAEESYEKINQIIERYLDQFQEERSFFENKDVNIF